MKYFVNDDRIRITEQPSDAQYIVGDEPSPLVVDYESPYAATVQWYLLSADHTRHALQNADQRTYLPDTTSAGENTYIAVISASDGEERFPTVTEPAVVRVIEKQAVVSGVTGDLRWELYNDGELRFTGDGACDTCGTAMESGHKSNCVCGEYHTGPFAWLIRFIHRIVYFFRNLFR